MPEYNDDDFAQFADDLHDFLNPGLQADLNYVFRHLPEIYQSAVDICSFINDLGKTTHEQLRRIADELVTDFNRAVVQGGLSVVAVFNAAATFFNNLFAKLPIYFQNVKESVRALPSKLSGMGAALTNFTNDALEPNAPSITPNATK